MLLPRDEEGVEHAPAVVDRDVGDGGDEPGLGVDLHDADVRAEGEGGPVTHEVVVGAQRAVLLRTLRRDLGPAEARLGHADDAEPALRELHVGDCRLEQRSRDLGGPRHHVVGGPGDGTAPSWSEREPPVPDPRGTRAVSDCSKRTCDSGTPSRSATMVEKAVA